jgi:hypothetical protein
MISRQVQFRVLSAIAAIPVAILPGCAGQKPPPPPPPTPENEGFAKISNQASEVFGAKKAPAPGQADAGWSIVIISAVGEDMERNAQLALEKVRAKGGLHQAYTERRGKSMVVAYGRYPGPDSKEAQADLKRIQNTVIDGATPFAEAILTPPPYDALPGSVPEYDLSTLKQRRGKNALYTLQVAAYTRMDGKPASDKDLADFRAAAEKAVVELRREGEEAFYHHGPRMSVVTVGVFGEKDVDPVHAGKESMVVQMARQRHPLNLVNGQGVKVRNRGQSEAQLQPSRIIVIPG